MKRFVLGMFATGLLTSTGCGSAGTGGSGGTEYTGSTATRGAGGSATTSSTGGSSSSSSSGTGGSATTSTSGTGGTGGSATTSSTGGSTSSTGGSTSSTGGSTSSTGGGTTTSGTGGGASCVLDGVLTPPEQCDDGNTIDGDGCDHDCTFSCTKTPDSCPNAETCDGVEVCTTIMIGTSVGQKCSAGVHILDCSACASGVCGSGACKASVCGDGCVDPLKGEQCEPPGTIMCSAACKTIVVNPCGNGVRDAGEQCDDGNLVNLDGCDASCKLEQDLRSNYLQMQFGLDAFCGNDNKLGSAITAGLPQNQVQSDINQGIAVGTSGFAIKMLGLASLTGGDDPALEVGAMLALPGPGVGYSGVSDLEWWYNVNGAYLDAARNPLDKLAGNLTGNVLSAGPGGMSLAVNFFPSSTTVLRLSSAKLQAVVGPSFAPGASVLGTTPGHLAAEHLDPALTSFASLGQPNLNFAGKLCGNAGAQALSLSPAPTEVLAGGAYSCIEGYSAASSLLDVFVSGCSINIGSILPVILPSQPDKADPSAPVAGAGAPYKLTANAQRIVTGCADKNNAAVPLASCLGAAAYSTYFRFSMGRVILK